MAADSVPRHSKAVQPPVSWELQGPEIAERPVAMPGQVAARVRASATGSAAGTRMELKAVPSAAHPEPAAGASRSCSEVKHPEK